MKKFYLLAIMVGLFSTINFSAKAQAFEPGKSYVSAGYGVGNFMQSLFSTNQDSVGFSVKILGPLFGKYEYAINEQIGVGLVFAYASATSKYEFTDYGQTYTNTTDWTSYSIIMRFNWHFNSMGDRLDPYLGFGFGYRNANWSVTDDDPNTSQPYGISFKNPIHIGFEATAGMRFMVTDYLGLYAEVGLAKAVVQFGVVTKF